MSESIKANLLNSHYARISTDTQYVEPAKKQTCSTEGGPGIHEFQIFKLLDKLPTTSPGTDGLSHWFLRIAGPSICSPIAHLFNLSLTTSIVPDQCKTSAITPVPKPSNRINAATFAQSSSLPYSHVCLKKS